MANVERGLKRLTWLCAVVFALPWVILAVLEISLEPSLSSPGSYLGLALVGFLIPWVAFFVGRWIVLGFRRDSDHSRTLVVASDDHIVDFARERLDETARGIGNRPLRVPSLSKKPLSLYEAVGRLAFVNPDGLKGYKVTTWLRIQSEPEVFDRAVKEITGELQRLDGSGGAATAFLAWRNTNFDEVERVDEELVEFLYEHAAPQMDFEQAEATALALPIDWDPARTLDRRFGSDDDPLGRPVSDLPGWKVPLVGEFMSATAPGLHACNRCKVPQISTLVLTPDGVMCLRHARRNAQVRKWEETLAAAGVWAVSLTGFATLAYFALRWLPVFVKRMGG